MQTRSLLESYLNLAMSSGSFFLKMADEFKMQNVTYLVEAEGEDLEGDVIVDESQLHRLEYT